MHGLVSLLPEPFYLKTKDIWRFLKDKYNLNSIDVTPFPHFSWEMAEGYDFNELKNQLEIAVSNIKPIKIETKGLSYFPGDFPIVFIEVKKNKEMLILHDTIQQITANLSTGRSEYYNTELWLPHISLTFEDLKNDNLDLVLNDLKQFDVNWKFEMSNLSLIYQPDGEIGKIHFKIDL